MHAEYRTPANAIVAQTAIVLALALSGSFVGLATLSVIARGATYIGTAAALPILRRRMAARSDAVRLPLGATIPIAALALAIALLATARGASLLTGAGALVLGGVIYWFRRSAADPAR